jgi:hypothetical protein
LQQVLQAIQQQRHAAVLGNHGVNPCYSRVKTPKWTVGSEENDRSLWKEFLQSWGSFNAVHARHGHIEDYEVRL